MANAVYPKAREAFLGGDLDWDTADVRLLAIDSDYTYSAAHDFLDDVPAGARIATSAAIPTVGRTKTNGTADADDVTFSTVAAGSTITGFILYCHDGGADSARRLIAFYDTKSDSSAISIPTNGGDVTVAWQNTGDRVFTL